MSTSEPRSFGFLYRQIRDQQWTVTTGQGESAAWKQEGETQISVRTSWLSTFLYDTGADYPPLDQRSEFWRNGCLYSSRQWGRHSPGEREDQPPTAGHAIYVSLGAGKNWADKQIHDP